MEVLALVVARSGSRGIPHKNVRQLGDYPLMAYSIAAGLQATKVTRTILSTDDESYRTTGLAYGAEVPFLRPKEYAQDDTPDLPVFEHALDWLWEHQRYQPDIVIHLRPTTPFRMPGWVDAAIQCYCEDENATSLRGVILQHPPPFKMYTLSKRYLEPIGVELTGHEEPHNMPRQDLPQAFFHTGQIDMVEPRIIYNGSMTGPRMCPFFLDAAYNMDIDTEEHWGQAERWLEETNLPIVRPQEKSNA